MASMSLLEKSSNASRSLRLSLPVSKRRASPKITRIRPGTGNRVPGLQASRAPRMCAGMTGAPDAAARRAAPGLGGRRAPSGLRPPSGKIPTRLPFLSRERARFTARGSPSSARTGIVCIPQ